MLYRVCLSALLMVALTACAVPSWEQTKKKSRALYTEYLNPPATIDYADAGALGDAERNLALSLMRLEQEFERLERTLGNADRPPNEEIVRMFMGSMPWLSGLAAVDMEGAVLAEEPSMPLKQLDYAQLIEKRGRGGKERAIRALVQDTPLGPEVIVAIPVFIDTEIKGLVATHFDMRSLMRFVDQPDDMIVIAPEAVLWSGRFDIDETPFKGKDWSRIVKGESYGTFSNEQGEFVWLARYLGDEPLIFATPSKGAFMMAPDKVTKVLTPATERDLIETPNDSLLLRPAPVVPEMDMRENSITQ